MSRGETIIFNKMVWIRMRREKDREVKKEGPFSQGMAG
jgi:hypothetical protein